MWHVHFMSAFLGCKKFRSQSRCEFAAVFGLMPAGWMCIFRLRIKKLAQMPNAILGLSVRK